MNTMTIYIGTIAEKVCNLILRNEGYSTPIEGYDVCSMGYWGERIRIVKGGKFKLIIRFVAYDNTTGDCWVEEFKTRKEAEAWIFNR